MTTGRMKMPPSAGFSSVEIVLSLGLIAMATGIFSLVVVGSADLSTQMVGGADLHEVGRRALTRVRRELMSSGRVTDPLGVELPHVFAAGQPDPALIDDFEHDVAALAAQIAGFPNPPPPPPAAASPDPYVAPELALAPSAIREIVYRAPGDVDGDGTVLDAGGSLEWGTDRFALLMVPDPEGGFRLVKRTVDAAGVPSEEIICRHVEAVTFDTNASKPVLPLDAVEIHLHLARTQPGGRLRRIHVATTIVMRNTP